MKNKRGMELTVNTLIVLVLGIFLLIALITAVTMNWDRLQDAIKGYIGSDMQAAIDLCENQCSLDREYDFCCVTKSVDDIDYNCPELNVSCSINCTGMCVV